jgi:hypothetical protein
VTLQDTVITGGYYLSSHLLHRSLFGIIHTLILGDFLSEGKFPSPIIFIRRLVHYFHNAFVLNDHSDETHLPTLSTINGAQDLMSLFAMAIFLNVFDPRTYRFPLFSPMDNVHTVVQQYNIFDLNEVPIEERHHACYIRGLAFDLINWFFDKYIIADAEMEHQEIEAYEAFAVPFVTHIGHQIVRYKENALESKYTSVCSLPRLKNQVELALFGFRHMKAAYEHLVSLQELRDSIKDVKVLKARESDFYDLDFNFNTFTVEERPLSEKDGLRLTDFLEIGQNLADKRYFKGVKCQFDLDHPGK